MAASDPPVSPPPQEHEEPEFAEELDIPQDDDAPVPGATAPAAAPLS